MPVIEESQKEKTSARTAGGSDDEKRDEREKLGFANVDEREATRRVRSSRSLTVGG